MGRRRRRLDRRHAADVARRRSCSSARSSAIRRCPARGSSRPAGRTGVFAITRHPMMWGFAIWAIVHLIVDRHAQGAGVRRRDHHPRARSARSARTARRRQLMGERWHEWTAQTAFVPFTRGRRLSRERSRSSAGPCCSSSRPGLHRAFGADAGAASGAGSAKQRAKARAHDTQILRHRRDSRARPTASR